MATQSINFTPSQTIVPTFPLVLDGATYTGTVTWNLFGQRYFLNVLGPGNTLVFTTAIVETGAAKTIQSLSWNPASLTTTVITMLPHYYALGATVSLTILGSTTAGDGLATGYNGTFLMLATGPQTLTYFASTFPGTPVIPGQVQYQVDLAAGYFNDVLIYQSTVIPTPLEVGPPVPPSSGPSLDFSQSSNSMYIGTIIN